MATPLVTGPVLKLMHEAAGLSAVRWAAAAEVSKFRLHEAEHDRLTLTAEEIAKLVAVLPSDIQTLAATYVLKVQRAADDVRKLEEITDVRKVAPAVVDPSVRKAFDALERVLERPLSNAQQEELSMRVVTLRRAIGLDAIKFI